MKKQRFNKNWVFQAEGKEPLNVTLPHDAMLSEKRAADAPSGSGGAYFMGGKYTYSKTFILEKEHEEQFTALYFEGVYKDAEVFLNGDFVAKKNDAYSGFLTDLSSHVRYGQENLLTVTADNSLQPNCRWYTGSGMIRGVNLLTADRQHIEHNGLYVRTLSIDPPAVDVELTASKEPETQVRISILDGERVMAQAEGAKCEITLPGAELWSEDRPRLYTCRAELIDHDRVLDTEEIRFGIRELQLSRAGLSINRRPIKLKGACIHQDNGLLGGCVYRDTEQRKARILKEAGFNAIRVSHTPASEELLEACDELGLFVMDEAFDQWYIPKTKFDRAKNFDATWEEEITEMVLRDRSHPSVILYSIGNEISETALDRGISLAGKMRETVKKLDGDRSVLVSVNFMLNALISKGKGIYSEDKESSNGLNGLSGSTLVNIAMKMYGRFMKVLANSKAADTASCKVFKQVDIAGYNYAAERYEKDLKKYPERVIVGSESLAPELFDNWQRVKANDAVIGDFIWTGWDYLGESGIACVLYSSWKKTKGTPLLLLGGPGVIDITGLCRPEVWLGKAVYNGEQNPCLAVEPVVYSGDQITASPWRKRDTVHSWSWAGCEGRKARIHVYSAADTVELFLNGKSLGRRKTQKCEAHFSAKYQPGVLRAVSYCNGQKVGEDELKTAGTDTQLTLAWEKQSGDELLYLDLLLTDKNGIIKASEDREVHIQVEGGELLGFGNADPTETESYVSAVTHSYYGRAQAILRRSTAAEPIKVSVRADGIEPCSITA